MTTVTVQIVTLLTDAGIRSTVYTGVSPNPKVDEVMTGAEAHGKHPFHRYGRDRVVHVHLGLYGTFLVHPVVEEALSESPYLTVSKGMYSAAYSAFEAEDPDGQLLPEVLQVHGIEHVDIVGLCTDYCVAQTALDAARAGLHTRVLVDFTAGVHPGSTQQAIGRMKRAGIEVV